MIFEKRRTMLLATLFLVCSFVVLQTACQDPEAVRKQTEAEAVAAWNQSQLEKEKAIQAQRDIEVAKARQAAIDAQNSAEWRDLIWKISQWILVILGGMGAVFLGLIFFERSIAPVITKRQELNARLKSASVYAAAERAKTEEAKAETARAKRAEEERKTKQAEAARAQDQKRIEEALAQQMAEPRLLEEAKARQVEAERKKSEAERKKKEAEAIIAQGGMKEAEVQKAKAVAKKAEEERRTEEANAKPGEEWRLGEEAKAKQGEEWRLAEEAKAKQAEEWRLGEEAKAKQAEEDRKKKEAEATVALRKAKEADVIKAADTRKAKEAEAKQAEDKRLIEEAKTEQARLKTEQQQQALALKEAEAVIAQRKVKEAEAKKAEEVRLAEEAKAKQAEEKRLAEQAKRAAQELAKQNKLESYPLLDYTGTFLKRLDELPSIEIKGDKERTLFELYLKLKEVLEKTGKVKLARKAELAQDAIRLHQIESLLDLYDEKIQRVRVDDGLGEDDREEKVIYWKSLRDRQVAEIQGH